MTPRPADLDREADAMEAEAYDCNSVRDRDDLLNEAQTLRARAWNMRKSGHELKLEAELKAKGVVL